MPLILALRVLYSRPGSPSGFADIPVSFSAGMTEGREDEVKMGLPSRWSYLKNTSGLYSYQVHICAVRFEYMTLHFQSDIGFTLIF